MTKVLTLKFGPDDAKERAEIHFLNVGDVFEGFGGSRHPLVAGRDYATGQKHKKPTASIVIRRVGEAMGIEDKELNIDDPSFWAWIGRLINDKPEKLIAEYGNAQSEG